MFTALQQKGVVGIRHFLRLQRCDSTRIAIFGRIEAYIERGKRKGKNERSGGDFLSLSFTRTLFILEFLDLLVQ